MLEKVTETLLLGKHVQVHIFLLLAELLGVFRIVFRRALKVTLSLLLVALGIIQDCPYEPELSHVLFGDRIDDVVELIESFLEVSRQDVAEGGVEVELVDVEGAEAYVTQVCLAASLTGVVHFAVDVACASWRLVTVIDIWELVFGVQYLVLVHNLRARV